MITDDPNHPGLKQVRADGQHETYLVLSEEERRKGFVRPLRRAYRHVGIRPTHPIRELTEEERHHHQGMGYVCFEQYPQGFAAPIVGRFWTKAQLASGCGTETRMGLALCETYARDPRFYGATFCVRCGVHRPVEEFIWIEDGQRVGS